VPLFAKHHNEFHTQHEYRAAKREARRSLIDTPIPEVDNEHHHSSSHSKSVGSAIHAMTATAAGPALADSHVALDQGAWQEIMAKRDAARHRSGSDMQPPPGGLLTANLGESSDEEGSGKERSPAITP
jgi:hypothetical protein